MAASQLSECEDAAPALRSAIQRRARLALALEAYVEGISMHVQLGLWPACARCLVDAIASQGLGPQAMKTQCNAALVAECHQING